MSNGKNLKQRIIQLRLSGMTYDQIAQELKCSKSTISYHLNSSTKVNVNKKGMRFDSANYLDQIQQFKEDKGCTDCGVMYPHFVLEFDHRPEFKKIDNVYRVLKKYGIDKAWQEIAKCDVVCSNCHKLRTYARKMPDFMQDES